MQRGAAPESASGAQAGGQGGAISASPLPGRWSALIQTATLRTLRRTHSSVRARMIASLRPA
eukprot:351732-Chlamydomonas_euryale.AAC.2